MESLDQKMKMRLQQGFAIGEMGFKSYFAQRNSKSGGSFYDDSFAHGFFARFFNSANVRPARRPSLVAVESSSSAWSERPASNAMNQRRKRAS